ncbi:MULTISPECIES: hypothetical protein [Streptococcus]|uniref:SepS10B protein n=2 Tax=Streptococcus suis TaxID=1307 RepID=Q5H825_STRSU|nr:hypothetical protein [Streptococcus suis]MBM0195800.1 hypothetical protein [Streptococcus suis]MBM7317285.1 hypothetical protein [Streptococcus suis]NQG43012.1 hypothetical protein [Streptococcus suis]NQG74248.1 hypothetical protein [Streptococcus suis]NQQ51638.1 hypothetical protein [Streptococcus suis]
MTSGRWVGTSYEIDVIPDNQGLINLLKEMNIGTIDEESSKYIVYNDDKSLAFLPEKYIEEQIFFNNYIDYFKGKDFTTDFSIFSIDKKIQSGDYREEVEKYKAITKQNNIVRLSPEINNISVRLLSSCQNDNPKVRLVTMIYILIMLSTNIDYDSESIFTFRVQRDERVVVKTLDFREAADKDYELLLSIYNWILFEEGSEYAYKQKLEIVREQLLRFNYQLSHQILFSAKSIFQRVIRQETDKYFEEIGNLKNDFFKLISRENDLYRSLHLKIIGWLSAIGILIFEEVKDYSGQNILYDLFFKASSKISILIFLLIIALVSIMATYFIEIAALKKEHNETRQFYTEGLMFDERDFDERVSAPMVDCKYIFAFVVLLLILLLRALLVYCL